ncbi:hypothetical protein GCM10010234_17850 [Streptomyces hawaiiensis]
MVVSDEQGGHPEQGYGGQPVQGPARRHVPDPEQGSDDHVLGAHTRHRNPGPLSPYHAWRAPFPLWARVMCDILFWAVTAAAAYVAIGSLCGAVLIAAPLLGFLGLASSKEHDDGIDWSDHRMGGQPRNPGPKM